MHQEELRAHCTSVRSDNGSVEVTLVPNKSKGITGQQMEVWPNGGPANFAVLANANQATRCWAVNTEPTRGCRVPMQSVSETLMGNGHTSNLLEVIL